MSVATPLFTQHGRRWKDHRYVYPVISRRSRGLSIGINLSPTKACNYDCVYCSVDRTAPPAALAAVGASAPKSPPAAGRRVDLQILDEELARLLEQVASRELWGLAPFDQTPAALRRLNDVAFSGDGEPTSAPEFPEAARRVVAVWDRYQGVTRDAKLVLITNATLLERPAVAEALEVLAARRLEIWAKLDAGTEAYHRQINRSAISLEKVVENILHAGRRRPLVIQAMFLRLAGEAPPEGEIVSWLERLRALAAAGCQIEGVQVYSVARRTADRAAAVLERPALEAIAGRVRALGLRADVFEGVG